jgi:tetratricopeptide (TPR) repeat protein
MPKLDRKLSLNYWNLGVVYSIQAEHEKCIANFKLALASFQKMNDKYGVALMWGHLVERFRVMGHWREGFNCRQNGLAVLTELNEPRFLRAHLSGGLILFSTGRYAESEKGLLEKLTIKRNLGEVEDIGTLRDLGLIVGMQGRYDEAHKYFAECFEAAKSLGLDPLEDTTGLRFLGAVLLRQGNFAEAEERLQKSLFILQQSKYSISIPEVFFWLGVLYETQSQIEKSSDCYTHNLDMRWTGRRYFECGALTGLIRVKHAQGDYAAIPPLLAEAEQLAQQYEYNDHLASLRLTQGHLAWEGITTDKIGLNGQTTAAGQSSVQTNQSVVIGFFQQAMIYALRYNRFLLDEVLIGRPQGTPLRPIIPECLKRGEEGRRMLIALRDWWQTGVNDIGTPRPDTISPIREGIPLLEAEGIAREREPGDGSPQKSVVEQIEAALKNVEAG